MQGLPCAFLGFWIRCHEARPSANAHCCCCCCCCCYYMDSRRWPRCLHSPLSSASMH